MFVDPRVAHGRARFELTRSPRMFAEERRGRITEVIVKSLEDFSGTPNRRGLMRLLEHQVAPRLERLGLEPYVGALGKLEGLFVNFITMSTEHGLREFQLQLTVPDMALKSFATNVIKPHAVARCMQRNGVMSFAEIDSETRIAFVFARALRPLAVLEKWQQAAVPTTHGLFVGNVSSNDDFHLNTYLRPGNNDRPSRWSGFTALFPAMPDWTAAQIHDGGDLLQWIISHLRALRETAALTERCPFLSEPYQALDDPLDASWNAAQGCADGQVISPAISPAADSSTRSD